MSRKHIGKQHSSEGRSWRSLHEISDPSRCSACLAPTDPSHRFTRFTSPQETHLRPAVRLRLCVRVPRIEPAYWVDKADFQVQSGARQWYTICEEGMTTPQQPKQRQQRRCNSLYMAAHATALIVHAVGLGDNCTGA